MGVRCGDGSVAGGNPRPFGQPPNATSRPYPSTYTSDASYRAKLAVQSTARKTVQHLNMTHLEVILRIHGGAPLCPEGLGDPKYEARDTGDEHPEAHGLAVNLCGFKASHPTWLAHDRQPATSNICRQVQVTCRYDPQGCYVSSSSPRRLRCATLRGREASPLPGMVLSFQVRNSRCIPPPPSPAAKLTRRSNCNSTPSRTSWRRASSCLPGAWRNTRTHSPHRHPCARTSLRPRCSCPRRLALLLARCQACLSSWLVLMCVFSPTSYGPKVASA